MIKIIFSFILFVLPSTIYAQTTQVKSDTCKCNEYIVIRINEHLKLLTRKDVYDLLYTFDKNCNNAEFGEYSNESLFSVLERYPRIVIELLSEKNKLNKKQIYSELSNPIEDMDYKKIMRRIYAVKENNSAKKKLITILHTDEQSLEADEKK